LERTKRCVFRLGHGEVVLGQVRLDQDQVVQGNLESRVAGARAAEGLLDEHAERKYSTSRSILTTALGL